jgi:hypothetical protein
MGFLNIAIFRDILGFWDLVRFRDFSKDFLGFLMKCTKIFRVISFEFNTVSIFLLCYTIQISLY